MLGMPKHKLEIIGREHVLLQACKRSADGRVLVKLEVIGDGGNCLFRGRLQLNTLILQDQRRFQFVIKYTTV